MSTNYPQYLLTSVIGSQGDYVLPPETAEEAGDGRLSQQEGWGMINQTPLEDGGIAPFRVDMNGLSFILSQFLFWYQQGGIMNYSSTLAYEPGNEVFHNGTKYRALQANGGSAAGVTPGTNPLVWKNMDHNVPSGAVVPFYNVRMGEGDNARNPIFWGETQPDESWVICDGGSDGNDGTVPNLVGQFIRGSTVEEAGQTGGSESQTLNANQIPAHTHTITINQDGSHTHTRGTMDITGWIGGGGQEMNTQYGGAFYYRGAQNNADDGNTSGVCCNFQASRTWSGETSSSGSHTHTATCSTAGEASPSIATLPPFYKLAFFVKLPEA